MARPKLGFIAELRLRDSTLMKAAREVLPEKPDRTFVETVQEQSKAESRELVAKTKRRGRKNRLGFR